MPTTPMYRVVQVGTGVAGSPDYITGYFDAAAGTAQQAAQAWRTMLASGASTFVTPYQFSAILTVDLVDPVTGNTTGVLPVNVGSLQFTSVGERLPAATALCINWLTGVYVNGRQVRGRTFVSRFDEAQNDGGVPSSAMITARTTSINTMLANVTVTHVVWSKNQGAWFETVAGAISPQWAVLKSRRD